MTGRRAPALGRCSVTGQPPVTGFRLRQLVDGSWKIIDT
jgi:hypothetical protein